MKRKRRRIFKSGMIRADFVSAAVRGVDNVPSRSTVTGAEDSETRRPYAPAILRDTMVSDKGESQAVEYKHTK